MTFTFNQTIIYPVKQLNTMYDNIITSDFSRCAQHHVDEGTGLQWAAVGVGISKRREQQACDTIHTN